MKRLLIAGTATFLLATMIGTTAPADSLVHAFISSEPALQVLRPLLIGLLAVLFFTSPPRSSNVRIFLGLSSVFLTVGVVTMLFQYHMLLLDALLFIEIAIISAIDAIESPSIDKAQTKRLILSPSQAKKVSA